MKRTFSAILAFCLPALLMISCGEKSTSSPVPTSTLTPVPTSTMTPEPTTWVVPVGTNPNYRAVHLDGNWSTNQDGAIEELPEDYFEWLREINVNWVGLSAELHVDDSMDSTVELKYSDVQVPTFKDEVLVAAFREFRKHGFNVYLTLNFDPAESRTAAHPVERYQMGCPQAYIDDSRIQSANWPWALDHPDHERFVSEFWQTYTDQAVHFARIAQQEGVGLFSLGTETECLFRTRPSEMGANDFGDEIRAMVQAVHAVYTGSITYDQHYEALVNSDYFQANTLWADADLDVIGISAYFPLVDMTPSTVMSVNELETIWESIFTTYLVPLHYQNPGKTILFTEFGYTDSIASPNRPPASESHPIIFKDADANSMDDGQETQANIYAALFHIMDNHPGVLSGAFLWGNYMASNQQWAQSLGRLRGFDIRWRISEIVVRDQYCAWIGPECTSKPAPATPTPWPSVTPTLSGAVIMDGQVIYTDNLAQDWEASGYLSEVDLKYAGSVAGGRFSIKTNVLDKWGALKLTFQENIDTTGSGWLSFQLNPGEIENLSFSVTIFSGNRNLTYVFVEDYMDGKSFPLNQWTQVTIPLSDLNPAGVPFDSFYFELDTQKLGTFYLDDIRLVAAQP
jgi:hypothetical protein